MNLLDADASETKWLTCGNESAGEFLRQWRAYVHGIDDIIDKEITAPEEIIGVFMQAAFVYSHPFYLAHLIELRQIVINCTNAYADVVAWENSTDDWKQQFADHYRHFGAEMVIAIAFICGGYLHMREASKLLRVVCWEDHHDEKGNIT